MNRNFIETVKIIRMSPRMIIGMGIFIVVVSILLSLGCYAQDPFSPPVPESEMTRAEADSALIKNLIYLGVLVFLAGFYWIFLSQHVSRYLKMAMTPQNPDELYLSGKIVLENGRVVPSRRIIRDLVSQYEETPPTMKRPFLYRLLSLSGVKKYREKSFHFIPGLNSGLNLILSDYPNPSRDLIFNILDICHEEGKSMLFISSRLSEQDVALGLLSVKIGVNFYSTGNISSEKKKELIEDVRRRRISLYFWNNFEFSIEKLKKFLFFSDSKPEIDYLILDDFSLLKRENAETILDYLHFLSIKNNIISIIIDNKKGGGAVDSIYFSRLFSSMWNVEVEDEEKVSIFNLKSPDDSPIVLNWNRSNNQLISKEE